MTKEIDMAKVDKVIKDFITDSAQADLTYSDCDKVLDFIGSLELIELVMDLEDEFNISISDDQIDEVSTFSDFKNLVKSSVES